jgi:hypothetical protein
VPIFHNQTNRFGLYNNRLVEACNRDGSHMYMDMDSCDTTRSECRTASLYGYDHQVPYPRTQHLDPYGYNHHTSYPHTLLLESYGYSHQSSNPHTVHSESYGYNQPRSYQLKGHSDHDENYNGTKHTSISEVHAIDVFSKRESTHTCVKSEVIEHCDRECSASNVYGQSYSHRSSNTGAHVDKADLKESSLYTSRGIVGPRDNLTQDADDRAVMTRLYGAIQTRAFNATQCCTVNIERDKSPIPSPDNRHSIDSLNPNITVKSESQFSDNDFASTVGQTDFHVVGSQLDISCDVKVEPQDGAHDTCDCAHGPYNCAHDPDACADDEHVKGDSKDETMCENQLITMSADKPIVTASLTKV